MSLELLVIFIVALLVFTPKQLPMLASHLAILVKKLQQLKTHAAVFWQQQLNQYQLLENQRKADEAERAYKKNDEPKY